MFAVGLAKCSQQYRVPPESICRRNEHSMANLLEQAINCNDVRRAAKIIQEALGIENDDVWP